ncbi:MAG TPA: hypothetical protein DCM40_42825 [Maribacter sp.]|nr:hypothetical protein [Maribacter sp.]|tara:strand:+ start:302 stop:736 length:435 start_codon:yes stop_codon:yes gene_type:complete
MKSNKQVVVSGGFDPIHVGHLRMFKDAARHGDLTVVINSDEWLLRKKGYIFMPWDERAELISSFTCVSDVLQAKDDDNTVCESLREIAPDIFANGGDRGENNTPESRLCEELGIQTIYNVGGEKVRSSSTLVSKAKRSKKIIAL